MYEWVDGAMFRHYVHVDVDVQGLVHYSDIIGKLQQDRVHVHVQYM